MDQEINQQRIQKMSQMLFEMAEGNFTKRIQRSEKDDELEALVVLMNMVAEEINESISHSGFINPHHTYKNLVQTTFVLDDDFSIKNYNAAVTEVLGFSHEMLYGAPFHSILSKESAAIWDAVAAAIVLDINYNSTHELIYMTQEQLLVPCFCTISRLMHGNTILISSVSTIIEKTIASTALVSPEDANLLGGLSNYSDVQLIQQVYDYILDHLDSPLPPLKELAQIFGTNDHKLKYGFKHLFKTSIYQFYTDERLKRVHLLIQQTTIPLNRIATIMGFNTYPNFSRAFKKHFDYAPNDIVRR